MSNTVITIQYGIERATKEPVVVFDVGDQRIAGMSVAQARHIAADIVQACARAEADAMIFRFFEEQEYPEGAANALMLEFRNFRRALDSELVERSMSEPNLNSDPT
jgi:hypothetical protein